MEILQATAEKMGIRFTTLFFVFFISFPVAFIVSSLYRNSGFAISEGLSQGREAGASGLYVTNHTVSLVLPQIGTAAKDPATTASGQGREERGRGGKVTADGLELGGTIQNVTVNDSLASGKEANAISSKTTESTPEEKLLGGLLTSGFDEESCISRTQSHLYRKASPHKPSPYLISKLRNYEEIHRRCGPNSRAYHKSMTRIEHSKNKGAATKCKYVIWTPANGLGNQMISIAATFLYGILTDRVLLVKFGKDKQGLFCEPFLNSTWISPENSPSRSWNEHNTQTYQTMLSKNNNIKASNSNLEGLLPSVLFINLQFSFQNPEKFFHCDHSQNLLRKIPILILQSDQYYVPSMFMNPFFNLEIAKMFPERDTIFHNLGRYLFHPSNEAWELISGYYQGHLANADERIGLQVRVFNAVTTPKQAIMNLVLSCMLKQKILPEVVNLQTSVVSSATGKNQTSTVNKVVLVASLYKEYGDNFRNMYMKNPTVSGEVIKVYQPSHEGKQKFNDNRHNLKAWMEMYLLSLCDVLVTTSLSTFGYVAQGLGNLKPWLLYKIVGNTTHFPSCERDFSTEPCFHMPPKHYCNGEPINIVSTFPLLRECKDFRFGVKLAST